MLSEDLRHKLMSDLSKANMERLADWIGDDEERFAALMELFFGGPARVTQWSAQLVSKCIDRFPMLVVPYLGRMIDLLVQPVHASVKRNTVRCLQFIDVPEKHWDKTVEFCFRLLQSHSEPIAVKVFAMTVLANLAEKMPEIGNELRLIIEDQLPYGSAGFVSRGTKILKKLKHLPVTTN